MAHNKLKETPDVHPFSYDLGVKVIQSKENASEVTICCHGYGHSREIVDVVSAYDKLPGHLVGFNFPDYGITDEVDHAKSAFGSIDEVLPLIYLLKYYACDAQVDTIHLYGFSAGGGAIINALAVLNQWSYKDKLKTIGVSEDTIKKMLSALQSGDIILDCPLKSVEEIIAFRGSSPQLEIMAQHYDQNNMNPIDVLPQLSGLALNIFLYFETPDDVLSNRDDALFVERLQKANSGTTHAVVGSNGGHNAYHSELWDCYREQVSAGEETMETNEFSLALKPSEIDGIGVFAAHDIKKGTMIPFFPKGYEPRFLHINEIPKDFLHFCVAQDNDMWACPRDFGHLSIGWFINHSFTPNVKRIEYPNISVALSDIKKGEELTMDYNDFDEPESAKESYYKK